MTAVQIGGDCIARLIGQTGKQIDSLQSIAMVVLQAYEIGKKFNHICLAL
jgi:predicted RNA-binding protein Jag